MPTIENLTDPNGDKAHLDLADHYYTPENASEIIQQIAQRAGIAPDGSIVQEARASAVDVVVAALQDAKQHRTTVLCALGQALLAMSAIILLSPWDVAVSRAALTSNMFHALAVLLFGGPGYVALHVGKCLMAQGAGRAPIVIVHTAAPPAPPAPADPAAAPASTTSTTSTSEPPAGA